MRRRPDVWTHKQDSSLMLVLFLSFIIKQEVNALQCDVVIFIFEFVDFLERSFLLAASG